MQTHWTRLIRFVAIEDNQIHYGEPVHGAQDVGLAYVLGDLIQARVLVEGSSGGAPGDPFSPHARLSNDRILTVRTLLAPMTRETVRTVRALGANYVQPEQDRRQAKAKRSKLPILFYKPITTLSGPDVPIFIPPAAKEDGHETDYEAELVVILGRTCRDVPVSEALSYVLGYTLSNDVSARKRMFAVPQWGLGKSFDWLPIGPCIVSAHPPRYFARSPSASIGGGAALAAAEGSGGGIQDPESVSLLTELNGEIVQDGNTRDHLWTCAEAIAELSRGTTLEAGSIISMGTPPGEGFKRKPEVWLKHGDLVRVIGSHGLGSLLNPVVDDSALGGTAQAAAEALGHHVAAGDLKAKL